MIHLQILWYGDENCPLRTVPLTPYRAIRAIAWALDQGHGIAFYVYG